LPRVKIGNKLRRERIAQTLTQNELAARAGISQAALTRIERNQADPHVSTIRKLADALGVDPRAKRGEYTGGKVGRKEKTINHP
jgi:transcriptional regulator with XRE-family HTH domain